MGKGGGVNGSGDDEQFDEEDEDEDTLPLEVSEFKDDVRKSNAFEDDGNGARRGNGLIFLGGTSPGEVQRGDICNGIELEPKVGLRVETCNGGVGTDEIGRKVLGDRMTAGCGAGDMKVVVAVNQGVNEAISGIEGVVLRRREFSEKLNLRWNRRVNSSISTAVGTMGAAAGFRLHTGIGRLKTPL